MVWTPFSNCSTHLSTTLSSRYKQRVKIRRITYLTRPLYMFRTGENQFKSYELVLWAQVDCRWAGFARRFEQTQEMPEVGDRLRQPQSLAFLGHILPSTRMALPVTLRPHQCTLTKNTLLFSKVLGGHREDFHTWPHLHKCLRQAFADERTGAQGP